MKKIEKLFKDINKLIDDIEEIFGEKNKTKFPKIDKLFESARK